MNDLFSAIRDRNLKSRAIEQAYIDGFTGCHLPSHDTDGGKQAAYDRDEFRDIVGKDNYRAEDALTKFDSDEYEPYNGVEGCYVFTAYAFEEFDKYNEGYNNWIFQMLQNSGNCVGASGAEMLANLLGILSHDHTNNYNMFTLASLWAYSYRGHCGSGWTMGAHASVTKQHGWCPATIFDGRKLGSELVTPKYNDLEFHTESQCERYPTSVWCRGRTPDIIESWVHENFMFEDGAIVEVNTTDDATYKSLAKRGASLHHGSNTTAGPGGLDTTRGIGGHAQTCYGQDWSDECIAWFKSKGVSRISKQNHAMLHGQTWGGGWSGEIRDENWPFGSDDKGNVYSWADIKKINNPNQMFDILHAVKGNWGWGPKNQGAWMTTVSTYNRRLASYDYAYFPKFGAIPGKPVPPTPTYQSINGVVYGEVSSGKIVLTGRLNHIAGDGSKHVHVIVPSGDAYTFAPAVNAPNYIPLLGTIHGEIVGGMIVVRGRPYHIDIDGHRYDHIIVPTPNQPGLFHFERGTEI